MARQKARSGARPAARSAPKKNSTVKKQAGPAKVAASALVDHEDDEQVALVNNATGRAQLTAQDTNEDFEDHITVLGSSDEASTTNTGANKAKVSTVQRSAAGVNTRGKRTMETSAPNGDHAEIRPSKRTKTLATSASIPSTEGGRQGGSQPLQAALSKDPPRGTRTSTRLKAASPKTANAKRTQANANASSDQQQPAAATGIRASGRLGKHPKFSGTPTATVVPNGPVSLKKTSTQTRKSARQTQEAETADIPASNQARNANQQSNPQAEAEKEAEAEAEADSEPEPSADSEPASEEVDSTRDIFAIEWSDDRPEFSECWSKCVQKLRYLNDMAFRRWSSCKLDRSARAKALEHAAKQFRRNMDESSQDAEATFAGADPSFFNSAVAAWTGESRTAERPESQAMTDINEIWGFAVPLLIRALVFAARMYRPQSRLSSKDLNIAKAILVHVNALMRHAQSLEKAHSVAPSLKDKSGKPIKSSQTNSHFETNMRDISTFLNQESNVLLMSSQQRQYRQTLIRAPDPALVERAAREAACQKYWDRLHSLRLMAAIPPGKQYVSSADMVGIAATTLETAQVSAKLLTDQVELWFSPSTSPDDLPDPDGLPISPPWSAVEWDQEHIEDLADSLHEHKGDPKSWAKEIYRLCKPWLHPPTGRMMPGPLAGYTVAEIVDQGMWTARVDLYDHWRKKLPYSPNMAMEDPRLVDQSGLKGILERWPVASSGQGGAGLGQLPLEDRGAEADVEDEVE